MIYCNLNSMNCPPFPNTIGRVDELYGIKSHFGNDVETYFVKDQYNHIYIKDGYECWFYSWDEAVRFIKEESLALWTSY